MDLILFQNAEDVDHSKMISGKSFDDINKIAWKPFPTCGVGNSVKHNNE